MNCDQIVSTFTEHAPEACREALIELTKLVCELQMRVDAQQDYQDEIARNEEYYGD